MGQFYGTQLYNIIGRTLQFLPPNALIMTYPLAAYVADAGSFLQLLLFPAALTGLLGWLTYRTFLRRRRV